MNVLEFALTWEKVLDRYETERGDDIPASTRAEMAQSRRSIATAKAKPEAFKKVKVDKKTRNEIEKRFVVLLGSDWKEKIQ